MKKIVFIFVTLIFLIFIYCFVSSRLPTKSESGEFTAFIVKNAAKTCLFKHNNCDYQINLASLDSELSFQWDYLLVFPKNLGYGEFGKSFFSKRSFLQATNLLFVKNSKPIHEEYELIQANDQQLFFGVDMSLSKNQLKFEGSEDIFFVCSKNSSLIVSKIDSNSIYSAKLVGCESHSLSKVDLDKFVTPVK